MESLKKIFSAKTLDGLSPAALNDLNSREWRRANSKWLWIVWGVAGGYGIPLVVQGARFRSPRMIATGVAGFAGIISFLALLPPADEDGTAAETSGLLFIALMIAVTISIGGAHAFNRDVLVEKAKRAHHGHDDWLVNNFGVSAPPVQPLVAKMDTATESILATSGLSPVGPGPDEKPRTPLLDINSASLQELVKSGVFSDDQLMAVVKKRESRPFRSIDELRVALDLKPHEFAQVRKKVEVTQTGPQPTQSPSSRIVDL